MLIDLQGVAADAPIIDGSATEPEMPRFTSRETLLTMVAVLLVILLASFDQTIVGTAMPHIIVDLQGFNQYAWVTTAYLLTSTVMVPIYSKLSDLFGRKPIFLIGVVLFLIGSAASGTAQSMNQLIAFRAFQGLGAAALLPIAIAVIGDLFTPGERGKWQGLTGGVFGLSSILGPTAGGWITDHSTWRWIFYVNLPIGIIALLVLILLMPTLRTKSSRKVSIDYLGVLLLIAGTVPLLLGFTWAGSQYDWLSWQIISLFASAVLFITVFIIYEAYLERRDAQPIINPSLFTNRIFSVSVLVTMITSMGMFGSILFLPLYVQAVLGISATNSGLLLAPLMLGLIISSVISGQLVLRFGKYKWIAVVGMIITIGGSLLLQRLNVNSTNKDLIIATIVLGFGLGFSTSLYFVIVQNALPKLIRQATSGLTFFRSIGGTIAVAAMGSILTSAYVPGFHGAISPAIKAAVPAKAISAFDNPNVLLAPGAQQQLLTQFTKFGAQGRSIYEQLMQAARIGLTSGIHNVYVLSTIIMCVGLVLVFFLKEIPLSGGKRSAKSDKLATNADEEPEGAISDEIEYVGEPVPAIKLAGVVPSLYVRLVEEPLMAQNLLTFLSAFTELYTKYWLIERGRFVDAAEYAQGRNDRFLEEAHLEIRTISKNSPTLIELVLGSTTAVLAIKTAIDAVLQTPLRYRSTHLANEKKALALKIQEQEAERVQKKEEQKTELEKQHELLELEKQKVDLEKQILALQQEQFKLQMLNREYAGKIAEELVNVAQPTADPATKTVLAQLFVPHLLQLRNVKGLEIVEPGSGEGEKPQLDSGVV